MPAQVLEMAPVLDHLSLKGNFLDKPLDIVETILACGHEIDSRILERVHRDGFEVSGKPFQLLITTPEVLEPMGGLIPTDKDGHFEQNKFGLRLCSLENIFCFIQKHRVTTGQEILIVMEPIPLIDKVTLKTTGHVLSLKQNKGGIWQVSGIRSDRHRDLLPTDLLLFRTS